MKILWISNSPDFGTGYGTQTAQVIPRLVGDGHNVVIGAIAGVQGSPKMWAETDPPTPMLPIGLDVYGNDMMDAHARAFFKEDPGWTITLFDVWPWDRKRFTEQRIASWTPVDHDPVPPQVLDWTREHFTIAMSQFGYDRLRAAGIDARYVPHAIEGFAPTASDFRAKIGAPESAFIIAINAANKGNVPPRKGWGEMFAAVADMQSRHADVWLYIHTDQVGFNGVDLRFLAMARGLDPNRLRWADQYGYRFGFIGPEFLAQMYTASDVLLATSYGEGFGIPVIEAQACGTPVIVTNATAQPELVGGGWSVACQQFWDAAQGSDFFIPAIGDIIGKLEEARDRKGDPDLRDAALAKAAEYDADLVFDRYWRPVLSELEGLLKPAKPLSRQQRRALERAAAKVAA